jgi:hypothetical protein
MTPNDPKRPTLAGALIAKAAQTLIEKSVASLKEAERLLSGQPLKSYLITYRLAKKTPSAKGDYNTRRGHLIALIKALSGKAHHVSTSAWIVQSRHATPNLVCSLLARALDPKIDLIGVDHVGKSATLGHHDLES